jgi:hypothetical protein
MKVSLVFPPTCDPTAPYLALPTLAAALRADGVDVSLVDANVEAHAFLLRRQHLEAARDRIEARLRELGRRPGLDHGAQLLHLTLWSALHAAHAVPGAIDAAVALLRDPERCFEPGPYADAVATVEGALQVISAAHAPLTLDFAAYRTPFALTSPAEIAADAAPERDPFHGYVASSLIPRLKADRPDLIGISVCFPGQWQPAYALALALRQALPEVPLVAGGPALTQVLARLRGERLAAALGPLDLAVLYEGERALVALCRALDDGTPAALASVPNLVRRGADGDIVRSEVAPPMDLRTLPPPDFAGLPLDRYLTPALVLPYDPTRGCNWGRCAFCHYGLSERGTARYRERPTDTVVEHLADLSRRWRTRFFYLSHDSIAPRTVVRLAEALADAGLDLRWGTDLRPDPYLTPARARTLRQGGAVAVSLGVESASDRVLGLMDKGTTVAAATEVVRHLADAGIAVEVMTFTGFPTETAAEARATLRWIAAHRDRIAAFVMGQFALTHGSRVAAAPRDFGVAEWWEIDGDLLGTALFFREERTRGGAGDRLEADLGRLSALWRLHRYPWAGSLSTAHSLLLYDRHGPGVLRARAGLDAGRIPGAQVLHRTARFDLEESAAAEVRDAEIWHALVVERRHLSRAAYDALAAAAPMQRPRPTRYRVDADGPEPERPPRRRPSHRHD